MLMDEKTEKKEVTLQNYRAKRNKLATLHKLIDFYGWSDLILTHISSRVDNEQYLLAPMGLPFNRVTAQSLSLVKFGGMLVGEGSEPVNPAGVVLHEAIYKSRQDVSCIIHTHTVNGVAVSMLKNGLQCADQMSLMFHNRIGYHPFSGISVRDDEQERIAGNLGAADCLVLENHGLIAVGKTVEEAFWNYYYLEKACEIQLKILPVQDQLIKIDEDIKTTTQKQHEEFNKKQSLIPGLQNNADLAFKAAAMSLFENN
ncbi:class II aldolase/adducin family protein [Piscirickettsia salmonis]|uniref:class II aldolase/adducin family protein n=1 Tax=Piscirickettsia salmonis TaxID=1238 RepID=UPI003EBC3767